MTDTPLKKAAEILREVAAAALPGDLQARINEAVLLITQPVAIRERCPKCGMLHVDTGALAIRSHHTHACQNCGHVWRPALEATVGVQFLPGFKDSPVREE